MEGLSPDTQVDVLFLVPHQDDELITLSAGIVEHLLLGHKVAVVLISDGAACPSRERFADGGTCTYLGDSHTYSFDPETYSALRDVEFLDSCSILGLDPELVLFAEPRQPDRGVSVEVTCKVIEGLLEKFPNAHVCTHAVIEPAQDPRLPLGAKRSELNEQESLDGNDEDGLRWRAQHPDHLAVAKAAYSLHKEGKIEHLELFVEFYHLDQFRCLHPEIELVEHSFVGEGRRRVGADVNNYKLWDPEQYRFALGWHSVARMFRIMWRRPLGYSYIPALDGSEADLLRVKRETAAVRKRSCEALQRCVDMEKSRSDNLEEIVDGMGSSTTWKVGRAVTALPRAIKDALS